MRARRKAKPRATTQGIQGARVIIAVLAEAPFVLHAWLRSGNTSSGRGVCAFLKEAFAYLPAGWRLRCLRADSGFFDQALLAMLEEHIEELKNDMHAEGFCSRKLTHPPPHGGFALRAAYRLSDSSAASRLGSWQPKRRCSSAEPCWGVSDAKSCSGYRKRPA